MNDIDALLFSICNISIGTVWNLHIDNVTHDTIFDYLIGTFDEYLSYYPVSSDWYLLWCYSECGLWCYDYLLFVFCLIDVDVSYLTDLTFCHIGSDDGISLSCQTMYALL